MSADVIAPTLTRNPVWLCYFYTDPARNGQPGSTGITSVGVSTKASYSSEMRQWHEKFYRRSFCTAPATWVIKLSEPDQHYSRNSRVHYVCGKHLELVHANDCAFYTTLVSVGELVNGKRRYDNRLSGLFTRQMRACFAARERDFMIKLLGSPGEYTPEQLVLFRRRLRKASVYCIEHSGDIVRRV